MQRALVVNGWFAGGSRLLHIRKVDLGDTDEDEESRAKLQGHVRLLGWQKLPAVAPSSTATQTATHCLADRDRLCEQLMQHQP